MFQILLPKNFRWCRWGDERRIKRAQPWERGPPYFCIIIYSYLLSASCVQRRSLFPRKMMVRSENYSYITIVNNFQIIIFRPPLINFNWQTPPIANSLSELSRLSQSDVSSAMKDGQVKSILVSVKVKMTIIRESKIGFQFQYVDQKNGRNMLPAELSFATVGETCWFVHLRKTG